MSSERILVVDDEEDVLDLVSYNLESNGYQALTAAAGETAMQMIRQEHPDLIVLDLMLPGMDGLEVCRALKREPDTRGIPIIMLTAKGEEVDIVTGLELGADDYVVKPFSPRVLLARIRNALRKQHSDESAQTAVRRDELLIDVERREVKINEQDVPLTYSEFMLLHLLARWPGKVFSRTQIINSLRRGDYPVTERSIDVQILGLRKKLGDLGSKIETVRSFGYRFNDK